jgi:triosephosphate isomerase (TIM)
LSPVPPARRPLLIGNWKMNLPPRAAAAYVQTLAREVLPPQGVDVAVAPAYPALAAVAAELPRSWGLVAQDLHWEDAGPYTGEVSAPMLTELGVTAALIGHSERRTLFGETDLRVARKVATARRHGLVPVVCVGEQEMEREAGQTRAVVGRQVRAGLADMTVETGSELVLAYEPVWAIGTGRNATPEQAQEVHASIRRLVGRSHGDGAAAAVRILYGGSVKPDNAAALMSQADVDGALVGGASLQAASFLKIVQFERG